ncbi:MAG TPA: hypothetical protein VL282_01835 [Tepidisphaeraceae bacterium]|jgi:hypothetical protein|nr:hypothetical protein [Tepidisphaeraceae bacterium]
MITILLLRIAGMLLVLLAVVNLFVPRRCRWADDLPRMSLLNRQIFVVHAAFIVLTVLMMAGVTLTLPHDLMAPSRLSRAMLAGMAIFWFARLLVQWFYYDRAIWRGDRLNTVMHFAFTLLWCYLSGTFAFALWQNVRMA